MPLRTLEFPVVFEPWQEQKVIFYLEKLKNIWNIGLARLNDFDRFTGYYNKETKSYNPCCPINWEYRRYWLDKEGCIIDKPNQTQKAISDRLDVPFSRIVADESKRHLKDLPQIKTVTPATGGKGKSLSEWLQWSRATGKPVVVTTSRLLQFSGVEAIAGCSCFSCPLPQDYNAPLLSRYEYNASGGLGLVIKGENLEYRSDKDELLGIPYKFRSGTIKGLSTSWQEYDKSRRKAVTNGIFRGKPKFKGKRDSLTTVVHPNPKGIIVKGEKDRLKGVPELGAISVPGLDNRWKNSDGSFPAIATFKICKCASGWYVQLTGELERSQGLRKSGKAIAADPGLLNYITFDDGRIISNPRYWREHEDKLARLQRELAHKRIHNLILWLNHPDRSVADIKAAINLNSDDAQVLLHCKTEQEGKHLIGQSRWSRLMYSLPASKAIATLEQRIKKQHENIRRMRRSFAHRLSTWLVRNYDIFVCEDGIQAEKLRHKSGIKLDENDVAQRNNSKAKSGLTKSLSDAAHGQLLELCAQKFKEAGRTFIRYPAMNTTKECPVCGTHNDMGSNYEGQRYHCSVCAWESGRDQKPGILMLMKLYDQKRVGLEQLSDATKEAIVYREKWIATAGGCLKSKIRKTRKPKVA